MSPSSLAFRLIMASAVWMLIALPLTGLAVVSMYRTEVEEQFNQRLVALDRILLSRTLGDSGGSLVKPTDMGQELFDSELQTGWYWQVRPVDGLPGTTFLSNSLLGVPFEIPFERAEVFERDRLRRVDTVDGAGNPIRIVEKEYAIGDGASQRTYSFAVSGNLNEIEASVRRFRNLLVTALAVLGASLLGAVVVQVRFGLRPLGTIGRGLAAIRGGEASELRGSLPDEIIPLQRELNALIRSNQSVVERARTHVGNLAHALKTPLAVIRNEASGIKGAAGAKIGEQAAVMQDQIQHYLDRARMAARVGLVSAVTEVEPVLAGLARALERIYLERNVSISVTCPPHLKFQGERQDLEEMLGNLLDNACKYAGGRVIVDVAHDLQRKAVQAGTGDSGRLQITIDDDGAGLSESDRKEALRRGRRLDESKPGSGLGLSIVADLVELYAGEFRLEPAPGGGLRARLVLPAA